MKYKHIYLSPHYDDGFQEKKSIYYSLVCHPTELKKNTNAKATHRKTGVQRAY